MDLLDIFDMSKKFERVMVPGSQTQGHVRICDEDLFHNPYDNKKPSKGLDYARPYQMQEENEMFQVSIM
jgi:hypothetical protein